MMNGVICVYKEKGYTSHDVVAKMRGIFRQKRIGHTGTLDPDAEGVLPVCLGNATKLCGMLEGSTKEYRTVLLLGVTTDTEDAGGKVLSTSPVTCTEEEAESAVLSFLGSCEQIPPMYSAVKIHGRKLVDLARKGITVERPPRHVQIDEITIERMALPRITMRVCCSRGTYIRTLCSDIGRKIGCGGCMEELLRLRSGSCLLEDAHRLSEISAAAASGEPGRFLIPTEDCLGQYQSVTSLPEADRLLLNGNPVPGELLRGIGDVPGEVYRVHLSSGRFVGLFQLSENNLCRPKTMFLT